MKDCKKKPIQDIIIHHEENSKDYMGAVNVPIYQSSIFSRKECNSGFSYTRINNPTTDVVEKKLAAMEKAEGALLFSSGMAAATASVMRYIKEGSTIVAVRNLYLPIEMFFAEYLKEKFGINTKFFNADDYDDFLNAVDSGADVIYLETVVSNVFILPDIERICRYAREKGIKVIVDNTYATPVFCNPLELGADIVVHSCSKYINGHSDVVAGAVMSDVETIEKLRNWERGMFGANPDPHQAWLVLRGMRTLALRMEQHMKNAMELAKYLEKHSKIEKVIYPALKSHPQYELAKKTLSGFPGLFCFIPAGGIEKAKKLYYSLTLPEIGPSWGGYETIMNAPGFGLTEERHLRTGIMYGQIRISVGLENSDTIIKDFERALEGI